MMPRCQPIGKGASTIKRQAASESTPALKTDLGPRTLAEVPIHPRFPPNRNRVIEVLAFPSVQLLDVAGPLQVFASANDLAVQAGDALPYTLNVVEPGGVGVVASAGLGLATVPLPPADAMLDTLVVAGGQGVEKAAPDAALLEWVRLRVTHARRVASVCTGAFLLATAGLLDGRRAVTHWSVCDELAGCFPAVHVEPDPIFIHDGPVWTSAGVTAGIDLALAQHHPLSPACRSPNPSATMA